MKKSLLLIFTLMLVVCAFAYMPRQFYTQILIEDADIMDHVTAVDPAHEANFSVLVEEVATGHTLSSSVNTLLARVCTLDIGAGAAWAWVFFDAQGLPTAGNVPEGATFTINLTYLPNTDPLTNTVTHTVVAPAGVEGVFNFYYPDFGMDSAWTLPQTLFGGGGPTEYTISGMFSTTNWDLTNVVIEATDILAADITYDAITGAYSITVPEGWSGTVTPTKAGFLIEPSFVDYTNVVADIENENYVIKKDVNPNAPVITAPTAGQVFEWAEAQTVTATWTAPEGFAPEYYEVKFGDTDWTSVNQDLTWTTPNVLGAGNYNFKVRGVINTPLAKTYVPIQARTPGRDAGNSTRGVGTEASVDFEVIITIPTYELAITSTPAGAAILLGGIATGNVTPYTVEAAGTYAVELAGYTFLPEDYVWDGLANASIEFVGTEIPTYDVEPDQPVDMDANTEVVISGPGFDGGNIITGEDYTPVPNANFIPTSQGILQLVGTGMVDIVFNFDPAVAWFVYMTGGSWIAVEGPLTTYSVAVDLGAKDATFEYKAGTGEDPTLPVELSVFNAVLTAQNYVQLSWTSESETNMLGYRVYRAESEVQAEAILITPIMIQATNTSTTQNYSIEDREVNIGTTYYYWLEAVDYSHSSFFGHRSVEVLGEITPELPVQSVMSNAYPNPFRASSNTTIEVKVRADETGTVTIYNVLGQAVKTYTVSEGNHKLTWNGRDSRGNLCGSGIYFARMSTPSMNQTKKMVIVK